MTFLSSPLPPTAPLPNPNRPDDSHSASAASGAGAADNSAGTRTAGNTQGRDPDLIYANEKLKVNGKSYTVKNGDTLTSIAKANGTSVDALIEENQFSGSLLGKNAQGQYFATGGPQPEPGGSLASPAGDNARSGRGAAAAADETSARRGSVQSDSTPALPQSELKQETDREYGIPGGAVHRPRAEALGGLVKDDESLSPQQQDRLLDIIDRAPAAQNGKGLSQEEKAELGNYIVNRGLN
jgi:LysM repeat protein